MTSQSLESVPLFAGLSSPQQALIERRLKEVKFAPGETLFRQGEPATRMILVESGWVRLLGSNGMVLATLGPGSTLADLDLLQGRPYGTSAQAVGNVAAWTLSAADVDALIQGDVELGIALSRSAGSPVAALQNYARNRVQLVPGWRRVSRGALMAAVQRFNLMEAPAGERLCKAGDPATGLYVIERGQVRLSESSGQEITLGAGGVLGEPALLTGKPSPYAATVVEDAILWVLDANAFAELTAEYPELREALSQEVHMPLSAAEQRLAVERLRGLPNLSRWPDDALEELAATLLLQHAPAGSVIFAQGARGDAMYIVESGRVELRSSGEVIARLSEGNDFGDMALLTGRTRTTDAVATADTNLWVLYRNEFERIQARYPAAQAAMTETLAQQLASAEDSFYDQHLRKISLLAGLSRAQLEAVRKRLQAMRYREGETIYWQGDAADGLYMIERGQVRVEHEGARSETLTVGDIFGEAALLLDEPRGSTTRALTEVDLWLLRREDFEDLMLQYPSLALNLSRVMGQRLRQTTDEGELAVAQPPAKAPVPPARQAAPTRVPTTQPAPTTMAATEAGGDTRGIDVMVSWFQTQSTLVKIMLIILLVLVVWLCFVTLPSMLIGTVRAAEVEARELELTASLPVRGGVEVETPTPAPAAASQGVAVAMANQDEFEPTPTYTPWPTETPIPTSTPTITPTPTETPIPTDTPTPLPTETATPIPTSTPVPPPSLPAVASVEEAGKALAAAAPAEEASLAAVASNVEWRLVEARRLSPCENKGNHHIFVKVLDAAGNPLDGVVLAQSASGNPGALLDRTVSGAKGPGLAEFVMWKGATYGVFIANGDGSPASTDFANDLHSGFTDEAECADGGGGNTLFHNSFSVVFQRTS